ncbi:hypothetical protein [Mariniblastus fucicola]|uniref:Uncharacterized protein n=1 Tax=Mariniblastus fucicola TaxID=980251 RepID=A0A5B9PHP3_9BACT|nr:hypothetical protein [Mariniblastus fucicola]QEG24820.1 hypothetical protein MFFC18_47430 [Mariniblastus fucicola]
MYYIGGKANSDFDFDGLVADLLASFPASTVITDDYYADRLERNLTLARDNGWPLDSPSIECLKRVGTEHGLQRHISVAVSPSLTFDSRIDKLGVFMISGDNFNESDAAPLLDVLRRYPLAIETE